jgi:hypothetical protein
MASNMSGHWCMARNAIDIRVAGNCQYRGYLYFQALETI